METLCSVNRRQKRLLSLLESNSTLDVTTLTGKLSTSEATIRRDLTKLEQHGKIIRTFGGARLVKTPSLVVRTFAEKCASSRVEKDKIAVAAARLVRPGMSIILDSGTTCWRIAAALKDKTPLKVLTSALAAIEELGTVAGISIYLTGGEFRLKNLDFVGQSVVGNFSQLRADIAFLSADSFIPDKGAFSIDLASAAVAQAIAKCANEVVMAVDHKKFSTSGCYLAVPNNQINYLITDSNIDAEHRNELANQPYKLIIADEKGHE
jgi:DeoR family fructose operon transcriptional repressor